MRSKKQGAMLLVGGALALFFFVLNIPELMSVKYGVDFPPVQAIAVQKAREVLPPPPVHVETPKIVKGIYMSACAAGSPSFRTNFFSLLDETELNSVIIDIKDFSGTISFPTENPALKDGTSGSGCRVPDMREFIKALHDQGIYVIGRVTVFQDPHYTKLHPELAVQKTDGAVWKDYKGLSFIDVGARPYWEYIVALSKESYALGFDELNFDYIRFPSDGNMTTTVFTHSVAKGESKSEALKKFFEYLDDKLRGTGIKTSADLFGMVTTAENDMGIGQVLENALPYFDYIAPMVYPSHYPPYFNGWPDPNAVPYEIVKFAIDSAVMRQNVFRTEIASTTPDAPFLDRLVPNQFRPWLQDNDYPVHYTPEMVRAQIRATYDAGLNSWMLWDAGNTYTRAALLDE